MKPSNFCGRTRREFLWQAGGGLGAAALVSQLTADGVLAAGTNLTPKAKSVIFLFMYGGPSHIDTFDHKPAMTGRDGQTATVKTFGRGGHKAGGRIVEPRWSFTPAGRCGKPVSSLFPNVAKHVDDIAFIHSMTADSPIHGSAMLMMNSGRLLSGSPAMGSWVNYGLGSGNENLPGFVVMLDAKGGPISGAKNWSSGFMPATHAGTVFKTTGAPILNLRPPADVPAAAQRRMLDAIATEGSLHLQALGGEEALASRLESYELAYRMQTAAPEAVDLSGESAATMAMYGIDEPKTEDFGRRCLTARRLVERGVRFVQLYSGGAHNDDNWDAHGDLELNHNRHAGATDLPIAALLADLKRTGLIDETLVIWGGEFGRQPTAEYSTGSGRDHNAYGFTMWMAGAGIRGGVSYGTTDELGAAAVENPVAVKELHATVLHLMGLEPNHLTYFHGGLDHKLVGVQGAEPIWDILA